MILIIQREKQCFELIHYIIRHKNRVIKEWSNFKELQCDIYFILENMYVINAVFLPVH